MDISLAHESAQRTLKQRNILAVVCGVLALLLVIVFGVANTKDREVVLQPILSAEMVVSSSSLTKDYLDAVTRDTAHLALNRSPESLDYWMDQLVAMASPQRRGELKRELIGIVEDQRGSQVSQYITIDWIRSDPEGLRSEVGGVLHTVVGSREVRREHKIFGFEWEYSGLSLQLKSFGVVQKKPEGEA